MIEKQVIDNSNNEKAELALNVNSKLPILKHIDDKNFDFDLKIDNINLKAFYPYLKSFGVKNAKGIINLDLSTIKENKKSKINLSSKTSLKSV